MFHKSSIEADHRSNKSNRLESHCCRCFYVVILYTYEHCTGWDCWCGYCYFIFAFLDFLINILAALNSSGDRSAVECSVMKYGYISSSCVEMCSILLSSILLQLYGQGYHWEIYIEHENVKCVTQINAVIARSMFVSYIYARYTIFFYR